MAKSCVGIPVSSLSLLQNYANRVDSASFLLIFSEKGSAQHPLRGFLPIRAANFGAVSVST